MYGGGAGAGYGGGGGGAERVWRGEEARYLWQQLDTQDQAGTRLETQLVSQNLTNIWATFARHGWISSQTDQLLMVSVQGAPAGAALLRVPAADGGGRGGRLGLAGSLQQGTLILLQHLAPPQRRLR